MSPKDFTSHASACAAKGGSHQVAAQDLRTGNSLMVSFQGQPEPMTWDLNFGKEVGSGNPWCGLLLCDIRNTKAARNWWMASNAVIYGSAVKTPWSPPQA